MQKAIEQISGETGISIRILVALLTFIIGTSITVLTALGGIAIKGIVTVNDLHHSISSLESQLELTTTTLRTEISHLRWTSDDMARLQQANQKAFDNAGIDVRLPPSWVSKQSPNGSR